MVAESKAGSGQEQVTVPLEEPVVHPHRRGQGQLLGLDQLGPPACRRELRLQGPGKLPDPLEVPSGKGRLDRREAVLTGLMIAISNHHRNAQ